MTDDAPDIIDDDAPTVPGWLFGWTDHPDRLAVAAAAPTLFGVEPGFAADADDLKDVFLPKAWKEVLGSYPAYPAQQIGDCTSFGAGHALDLLQCVEIALGEPEEYKEICTEAIYGIGREVAGMLGSGDGCYGGAVAKALTDHGAVPREAVGAYSGQRAKQWGRSGVPREIKDLCGKQKLGAATLVATKAELDAALNSGYPVTVASNQGFTQPRDSKGICYPRGSWPHQMAIVGRAWIDGKPFYLIIQSWGDQLPGGPTSRDQPAFSFFAPADAVYRMIGNRDSWAFSLWGGFQRRDLPPGWSYMGMS